MVNGDNTNGTQRLRLTETERHELLADELRRETISVLGRAAPPLTLQDLAHTIWVTADGQMQRQGPENLKIALHHNHLPKLADYGVVTYDAAEKTVVETQVGDAFDL
ncbi:MULTISPECIES: DUF7344 domain-containing protein [Haloarcula]|uniref:DUF7344 domain-containing protein n=1 Tax=Haloarcula TaxID=2237 RepID=UPI0023EB4CA2|nr:hypothetical protein [Halomicroarcula sp. XH51]